MSTSATPIVLHRQAFIYNGSIDKSIGSLQDLITQFLKLNYGNNRPLLLRITSSGGVPEQIFGLCGLLRQVKAEGHPLHVHVLGQLSGFPYMIAAVADVIEMEESASFVFGQMKVITSGSVIQIGSFLKFQRQLFDKLVNAIVERSKGKLKAEDVRHWRGKHITAAEAVELGLCDKVLTMPETAIEKTKPEHVIRMNGSFSNDQAVFDLQVSLHNWLEDQANDGRPLKVYFTSWGGTVVQALSLYGLLCEAQRQGHHVTIQVMGEAYSCALWFCTCAIKAGTVLLDRDAMLMFHPPWMSSLECDLDIADELLSAELGIYQQTTKLLQLASGFTDELIARWEASPADQYFTANEAVDLGLGKLA